MDIFVFQSCVTLPWSPSVDKPPGPPRKHCGLGRRPRPAACGGQCGGSGRIACVMLQPTKGAGSDRTTVSVHGLAGSSFELEVSSGDTGWDATKRIAARVGQTAAVLMLTSGGCVIDQRRLLLHQVQHREITYVVQKLGAGGAARSLQRLLDGKTLTETDVVALNETVSLTCCSVRKLQSSMKLLHNLQSLTFGGFDDQSWEGIQLPSSLQSLTFDGVFIGPWRASNYPAACRV